MIIVGPFQLKWSILFYNFKFSLGCIKDKVFLNIYLFTANS